MKESSSNNKIVLPKLTTHVEGSILVNLWHKILRETNYIYALEYMVAKYTAKNKSSIKAEKRRTKSSIIKNITSDVMTWKTFIDLIFNFLNVKKMTMSLRLEYPNGKETIHSITVDDKKMKSDLSKELEKVNVDFVNEAIKPMLIKSIYEDEIKSLKARIKELEK